MISKNETKEVSEEEIIAAAKADSLLFKPLYEKYFKRIFLFVYHRVEDRDLASDLTSQIFLKALQKLPQYKSIGLPFSSWLYRIAVNECNDFFRKTKRSKVIYVEDTSFNHLFEEMFPESPMDQLEKKLHIVLQQLKREELQVIELRYFENMSFKMVAEILGQTENNVKVKTYRTIAKMKAKFLKLL